MPADSLDPIQVALLVARAFERVGAGYFLGGSLASSVQGEPRATNDIDFVTDLNEGQVTALERELGPDFDLDPIALREAVRARSSWNIFHVPSMTKVDLFLLRTEPFDRSEFDRRGPLEIRPGERLSLKTPEDTVLRKLLWFRAGGEASAKQWRDVVEVLRVSGSGMDSTYLDDWADRLGVTDLLSRALTESEASR